MLVEASAVPSDERERYIEIITNLHRRVVDLESAKLHIGTIVQRRDDIDVALQIIKILETPGGLFVRVV